MNNELKRLITMFLGLILIIVGFVINKEILRPILVLLGIISLTISNAIERNNKKVFIPLFAIIFFLLMVALDYLVVGAFKKTPIFSYSIVSTNKSTVYNAIGYRVWVCHNTKDFKVDPLYKLGYYCSNKDITAESINNILPKIVDNFDLYKDAYMKINGKVSKIVSDKEFYMQVYDEIDNTLTFNNAYILDINFNYANEALKNYKELDDVTIVGKIDSFDGNMVKVIDSNFLTRTDNNNTDQYTFDVNSNIYCEYDKDMWFMNGNIAIYRSCINSLDVKLNDKLYDLSFAIKNNMMTLDELKDAAEGFLTNSKDASKIYIYNNFRMLECENTDIIIGKESLSFDNGYCNAYIRSDEKGV